MSDNNRTLERRSILKAMSAAGLMGVAGCTGGDGSDGGSGGDGGDGGSGGDGGDGGSGGDGTEEEELNFPEEDMTFVIPYGTGGGFDTYTRLVVKHLQEQVPVDVTAQNVTGSGGLVALKQVYGSDPDGYTSMIINSQGFAQTQVLRDIEPDLSEMTYYPQIAANKWSIGVGSNTNIETWDDYVTKVQNEEVQFYAVSPTSGAAIVPVVAGELTGAYSADKVLNNIVIFDGKSRGIKAISSGEVQVMASTLGSLRPYMDSGDLRAIIYMTMDDEPPEGVPDTLKTADVESGQEIADTVSLKRIFAGPPDVPQERADYIREKLTDVIQSDEFQQDADDADRPIEYEDSETARTAVLNSLEKWEELKPILEDAQEQAQN